MPAITNRKQEIYEAAALLFRQKGFAATSMRDLAREVNLTASSLYNHINSKQEILQDICFSTARRFDNGLREIEIRGGSPTEKIEAVIRQHVQIATTDRTAITAFNDEWRHLEEPWLEEFIALRRDYEARFRHILSEGVARGEFRAVPLSLLFHTILSSLRWVYDWFEPGRNLGPADLEREMVTLILRGVSAR